MTRRRLTNDQWVDLIRRLGPIDVEDLAAEVGCSKATVYRNLRGLLLHGRITGQLRRRGNGIVYSARERG